MTLKRSGPNWSSGRTGRGSAAGDMSGLVSTYLNRSPERLVLEGYRCWTAACIEQNTQMLDRCWSLYEGSMPGASAKLAFQALGDFIETLGRCASCPLKTHLSGAKAVCRDEVLVLGLIAALQIGDDQTAELCLAPLGCPAQRLHIRHAALSFATILKGLGQKLVPIPASVVERLQAAEYNGPAQPADPNMAGTDLASKTLH